MYDECNYEIAVVEEESPKFVEFLECNIREFNNQHSLHHRLSREVGAVKSLNIILLDDAGSWIGGLSGKIYWEWLEIENFFLPQKVRGIGIGTSVLSLAENTALKHGARRSFLTTYSFQARQFYEKHGYVVVGQLDNYPPDSTYFWMRKDFLTDSQ